MISHDSTLELSGQWATAIADEDWQGAGTIEQRLTDKAATTADDVMAKASVLCRIIGNGGCSEALAASIRRDIEALEAVGA